MEMPGEGQESEYLVDQLLNVGRRKAEIERSFNTLCESKPRERRLNFSIYRFGALCLESPLTHLMASTSSLAGKTVHIQYLAHSAGTV